MTLIFQVEKQVKGGKEYNFFNLLNASFALIEKQVNWFAVEVN